MQLVDALARLAMLLSPYAFGRDWMLGLGVLSYLSPGLLAVGPVRFGSSPPAWFTEVTLRAQDLRQLGASVPDAAADRDRPDYSDYANGVILGLAEILRLPLRPCIRNLAFALGSCSPSPASSRSTWLRPIPSSTVSS